MSESAILFTEENLINIEASFDESLFQIILSGRAMRRILEDKEKYYLFLIRYTKEIEIFQSYIVNIFDKLKRRAKLNQAILFEDSSRYLINLLEDEEIYKNIFDYETLKLGGLKKIQYFMVIFDSFYHSSLSIPYWNQNRIKSFSQKDYYSKYFSSGLEVKDLFYDYFDTELKIIKSLSASTNNQIFVVSLNDKIIFYDNSQKEILSSLKITDFDIKKCTLIKDPFIFMYSMKNMLFILNFAHEHTLIKQKINFSSEIKIIYQPNKYFFSVFTYSCIHIFSIQNLISIASIDGFIEPSPCHFDLIKKDYILFYENKYYIKLFSVKNSSIQEY